MFGCYRTLLAVVVIADHTTQFHGIGAVAVFAFFCLSGFLMTILISGPYAGRPGAFFLNRFLRLYPIYWITAAAMVLLWLAIPDFSHAFHMPTDPWSIAKQALYVVSERDTRIVTTAWAVTNELGCYLLIGLGITRSRFEAVLSFLAAAAFTLYWYETTVGSMYNLYFPPWGALLPFALGALLAQFRELLTAFSNRTVLIVIAFCAIALAAAAGGIVYAFRFDASLFMPFLYASLLPSSGMVLAFYRLDFPKLRWADAQIGRLSYPMYLSQCVAIPLMYIGLVPLPEWLGPFAITVITTLVLSTPLVPLVDRPIERLRSRIKTKSSQARNFKQRPPDPAICSVTRPS